MGRYEPTEIGDEFRPLYDCWRQARGPRAMPARADMDPLSMPRQLLPNIFLLEVHQAPQRFRFRLVGTAVVAMLGEDWTGKFVDELRQANQQVTDQYVETLKRREPTEFHNEYSKYDPSVQRKRLMHYRRLLLPMSDDEVTVNMLLGAANIQPIS
ncbi:MAG: PAS domain-containing protein [Rhodospirillaceae bacterium]|jgi:hypothetical protein|nr:PAS domain-containing protein [Rhodospirillaceae bacterium]MBT3490895.1 PAS domain-containing protein [Rhodospirillaceae bacterium]MBT3781970.1 PAS domain-containing protein [Rhodospirillaceae bacterium]MBT3978307.1 PAS domain-containing protein [Rhodospirillaceae bacterium]MBT4167407.1 PAS domain-containing protein [Rhodospirillaceae bacterium]